jgi:hypothetical protein
MSNEDPTSSARQPAIGDVIRNTLLETEATYRVCGLDGAAVVVEVLEAPGLERGQRLRFTTEAVRAMELMTDAATAPADRRIRRPVTLPPHGKTVGP